MSEEKSELEFFMEVYLRKGILERELEARKKQLVELVHSLVCNQDLPERSVVKYKSRTYYLVADVEECDAIEVVEVDDITGRLGQ